ncbi:MAG: PD-(D/E)XK nuclease family protein, partial [Spirochaetales bacterium]|nr:PD-(D/E)XK nuclease family protein [Spirochaetales bacterium]
FRGSFTSRFFLTDLTHRRLLSELAQLQRFDDLWPVSDIKPVDLAISYLSSMRYLPEMHANAVQVHDYSTTEGYAALRMYVTGASLEGLQRYATPPTGLRRELVTLLEVAQPRDLARSLQAHQLGQTVFSHATASFSGFESPHPLMHTIRPAADKACTPTFVEQLLWEQVWAGDASSIIGDCRIRITQGQRLRFEQAGHALRKPGYNEPCRLSADLVNTFLSQTASLAGDVPRFDPHSLKEYSQCPCKWFAARLRLEDELPKDRTDLVLGNLLHQIYREFVSSLGNSWAEPDMALPLLQHAAATSMEYILRKEGEGFRPLLESYLAKAVHRLGVLYQYEYEHFSDFPIRKFEMKLEAMLVSEGAVLGGRLDCIMERETDGVQEGVIIDYKKKTIPKNRNLQILQASSPDEEDGEDSSTLEELQVPIYAMLYSLQGGLPAVALYHSIENNEQTFYLKRADAGSQHASQNAEILAAAERAIRSLASRSVSLLRDGHLLDPAFERTSCGNCSFKPLCRYWYFSEF